MNGSPVFFEAPEEFRAWLEEHHESETELYVGFWKKAAKRKGMNWAEAVDEALSFGWIDGRGNRIDDLSHQVRFTPRRRGSIWSKRNIGRVAELKKQGRMRPAGLAAFEARTERKSGIYSHERAEDAKLSREQEREFRANRKAWKWFQEQAPSYRRTAIHLVITAKREETRRRRLLQLIECSADGQTIPQLTRRPRA